MPDVNAGTNRLVGRDRELATLAAFLGEAVADGATLMLTGEPGAGETALLVAAAVKVYPGASHGLFATHTEQFNGDLLDFVTT